MTVLNWITDLHDAYASEPGWKRSMVQVRSFTSRRNLTGHLSLSFFHEAIQTNDELATSEIVEMYLEQPKELQRIREENETYPALRSRILYVV